jgi:hypothetical protein
LVRKTTKDFDSGKIFRKAKNKMGKSLLGWEKGLYLQPKRAETFQTGGIPKSHKSR